MVFPEEDAEENKADFDDQQVGRLLRFDFLLGRQGASFCGEGRKMLL